jgi:hypothetical protein
LIRLRRGCGVECHRRPAKICFTRRRAAGIVSVEELAGTIDFNRQKKFLK